MKLDKDLIDKSMKLLNIIATELLGDSVSCEDEKLKNAMIAEYDALDIAIECMRKVKVEIK